MWICGYSTVCMCCMYVSYEQNYDIHVDYCMYKCRRSDDLMTTDDLLYMSS
jgi:hypothetical protein